MVLGQAKFTGRCYKCGKIGHMAKDCRARVDEPGVGIGMDFPRVMAAAG